MKILILASYYPPLNITSSNRISAFVKYLSEAGNEITVITRYYDESQCSRSDLNIADYPPSGFNEDYIREKNVFYTNYSPDCSEFRFFNSMPPGLKGIYNYYKIDVYHFGWIKYVMKVYERELTNHKFDFIIASSPPFISWSAASILSKATRTPWIADMRDSFITEEDSRYHAFLKSFFYKYLLFKASAIFYVSEGMKAIVERHIPKLRKKPNELIYNGIDPPPETGYDRNDKDIINFYQTLKSRSSVVMLHTGSLYPKRNLDEMVNYTARFNAEKPPEMQPVVILCVGLQDEFIGRYKKHAEAGIVFFFKKVAYPTSLYLQKKADILLLPVWQNGYTEFSGKVFEYLYSENLCLVFPKPKTDLDILLSMSKNIVYLNNYSSFTGFIEDFLSGKILSRSVPGKNFFLRSFHVKKMNDFLIRFKQEHS